MHLSISLVLLAAVVIGGAAATGHIKHECQYRPADQFGINPAQKTCSWKWAW